MRVHRVRALGMLCALLFGTALLRTGAAEQSSNEDLETDGAGAGGVMDDVEAEVREDAVEGDVRRPPQTEAVRDFLRAKGLLTGLQKVLKTAGPSAAVAPVLFIGTGDVHSSRLATSLFGFVTEDDVKQQSQVVVAPFGDLSLPAESRPAIALVNTYETEEVIASPRFPNFVRETSLALAVSSDVIYTLHYTDLIRGEAKFALLQTALEQFLKFQAAGVLAEEEQTPKTLHVVLTGIDEAEAEDLGLSSVVASQLTSLWARIIKPKAMGVDGDVHGVGSADGQQQGWTGVLSVNVVYLPNEEYADEKYKSTVGALKSGLEQKLVAQQPFVRAKALERSVSVLGSAAKEWSAATSSLPKDDTAISAFYLDKLVARYAAQFRSDARRLQKEMEGGYDEEFGKIFTELMDKYLTDFQQEIYSSGERGPSSYLQGLDAKAVAGVVKRNKELLRRAMLATAEEAFGEQVQLLRRMVYEEFRKGISAFKYHWELVPGFTKAVKSARTSFATRAAKLTVPGAKWSYANELRQLTATMEDLANDVIERNRATGAFVPTKLRRPVGVQINWLGSNFFHFLRDSSCDPLSIRTDSGVALWQTVGETWAKKTNSRRPFKLKDPYGEEIDPVVLDYLLVNPKGVGIGQRDPRSLLGWNRRLAYDLVRNLDDMTFQVTNAKGIAAY